MTDLAFFGGVGEIGGNRILIHDGKQRIFFDFGKNFAAEGEFFEFPFLKPRDDRQLLDLGMLPKIDGLYKCDDKACDVSAVFVSHPHLDHYGCIRYLKDNVPIHCGETAMTIMTSREACGRSNEYCLAKFSNDYALEPAKDFHTFRTGSSITDYTPISVEPIHMDHSVPGAYSFLIETSDSRIAYTGDFRTHGTRKDMTEDFVRAAKKFEPDVLIIEGTNVGECKVSSEKEVAEKLERLVSSTPQLVMASFSMVDVDRLRSFYEVAKKTGRELALTLKQAFLIDRLAQDSKLGIFSLADPNIRIIRKEKSWYSNFEKYLRGRYASNLIGLGDVSTQQNRLILVASIYDMPDLMDAKPAPGSVYIQSSSEARGEEDSIGHEKFLNWLNVLGAPLFNVHASGHANPLQLREIIKEIEPKTVIPVHTSRPEMYQKLIADLPVNVMIPQEEEVHHL